MANFVAQSKKPNILITGTPGTGKTVTASAAAEKIDFAYINIGDLVKEHNCHTGKDEKFDSYIVDDEKLLDVVDPLVSNGGCIVDYHDPGLFPEDWFDLVLVLRAETSVLFDRLTSRGYSDAKRSENIECEIMQICLEEAMESYDRSIVNELPSNTLEDLENSIGRIVSWYEAWKVDNQE